MGNDELAILNKFNELLEALCISPISVSARFVEPRQSAQSDQSVWLRGGLAIFHNTAYYNKVEPALKKYMRKNCLDERAESAGDSSTDRFLATVIIGYNKDIFNELQATIKAVKLDKLAEQLRGEKSHGPGTGGVNPGEPVAKKFPAESWSRRTAKDTKASEMTLS